MADQEQQAGQQGGEQGAGEGSSTPAPAAPSSGNMMDEMPAFVPDPNVQRVDPDFIMATFFGGGDGDKNSSGDQGSKAKPGDEGNSGVDAPSPDASAAQGSGGEREELPPFPGAATPPQQPAGAKPQSQSPTGQGQPPSPAASAPAGQPQLPPEVKLELDNLKGLVASLQQSLAQAQQQQPGQSGTGTQPGKQPGDGGAEAPKVISLAVPDDVMQAVFDGENPQLQRQGMNFLVSSVATATMQRVMEEVGQLIDARLSEFDKVTSSRSAAKQIEEDYYSAFPNHRDPIFKNVVQQQYQAVFAEKPGLTWNADVRNAVGARVNAKLKELGFQTEQQQEQQEPPQQQQQQPPAAFKNGAGAKPTPMLGTGTRPSEVKGAGDFIKATLG